MLLLNLPSVTRIHPLIRNIGFWPIINHEYYANVGGYTKIQEVEGIYDCLRQYLLSVGVRFLTIQRWNHPHHCPIDRSPVLRKSKNLTPSLRCEMIAGNPITKHRDGIAIKQEVRSCFLLLQTDFTQDTSQGRSFLKPVRGWARD